MKLDKTVKYSYYKNLSLIKRISSLVNKNKMLIALGGILITSAFNPMIAKASNYYEPSAISSEVSNDLSSSEKEKLAKIMEELKRIKEEVQTNIDIYNDYQNRINLHTTNVSDNVNSDIEEEVAEEVTKETEFREAPNVIEYSIIEKDDTAIVPENSQESDLTTPIAAKMNFEITNSNDEQRYNIFNEYSGYYGLDTTAVYNLAKTLTSDFSETNYLSTYVIGNTTFYDNNRVYPNEEAGIIAFIRCLALSPENYGISANDIKTGVYTKYSGSYEQLTAKISDLLGVNRETMLAIMYHETGYFSSDSFIYKNNPAGIMKESGGVKSFENKEAGIIEAIYNVYFRFYEDNKNISLEEIGTVYCPVGAPNDDGTNINWISGVGRIKEEIKNNLEVFENGEKSKGI